MSQDTAHDASRAKRRCTARTHPLSSDPVEVRMQPDLTIDEAVARINAMETEIKRQHPEVGWCFVEPDVTD